MLQKFVSMQLRLFIITIIGLISIYGGCSKDKDSTGRTTPTPPPAKNEVDFWLTKGDQSILLQKQAGVLAFNTVANSNPEIIVDTTQRYQSVDGFGYTLTSGSATLINSLPANSKTSLLQELFGKDANGIGVSYLRVSIGASDLSASVYTYDDMPAGQTDPTLANFSLDPDRAGGTGLIPLLKEILVVNPNIKILGSPWTPPVWLEVV
jgi:glucosylceramidase